MAGSLADARRNMVDGQLRTFDVNDRALLAAMGEVPRERFVPPDLVALAYRDGNLPLPPPDGSAGETRTLLAPMVLARLIQALRIEAGMRVLDVAGGQGYSAEILRRLGASVVALESDDRFASTAASGDAAGLVRRTGDLAAGCPDDAPFGAILINGMVETEPSALLGQLAEGGCLACLRAVAGRPGRATLYVRTAGVVGSRALFDAAAPPLDAFRAAPAFVF